MTTPTRLRAYTVRGPMLPAEGLAVTAESDLDALRGALAFVGDLVLGSVAELRPYLTGYRCRDGVTTVGVGSGIFTVVS